MKIVIDSREQTPFVFRKSKNLDGTVVKKLDAGDYSIEGMEHLIAVERKSAADLFGTLGRGNKRFQRELRRASNMEYFAIVVECDYTVCSMGAFKNNKSTMRPDVVMKILGTLMHKYNIHVFFAHNPVQASSMTRWILQSYYHQKTKKDKYSLGSDLDMVKKVAKLRRKIIVR